MIHYNMYQAIFSFRLARRNVIYKAKRIEPDLRLSTLRFEHKGPTLFVYTISTFELVLISYPQKSEKGSYANAKSFWFFGQNMKTRSKRSEAKNCLSSKNVNLCLLDSVESIIQGIKIL